MRRSMAAALILTVLLFGGAYLTTGGSAAQEPESGDDTAQEPSGQGRQDGTVPRPYCFVSYEPATTSSEALSFST